MRKVLQQGQADGLCGIYAVLNFLNTTFWKSESPSIGLWYLLDSCRHFGWLTPQNITEGFEDFQLKAILDLQFANYRMPFRAEFLSDVSRAYPNEKFGNLVKRITTKNGAMIVPTPSDKHWLLIVGSEDGPVVCDSADGGKGAVPFGRRRFQLGCDHGVVVVPRPAPIAKIDI